MRETARVRYIEEVCGYVKARRDFEGGIAKEVNDKSSETSILGEDIKGLVEIRVVELKD